jgi:hypothetical protein
MLESCEFPKLPARYNAALREAVAFILDSFKPVGIIASGTIIRGHPDPTSDLDLWVIHFEPVRQRIQKFFNAVPAEIFVNPPWVIQSYFTQDQASARPISAHMIATGFVVLATDPVVEELRQKAAWLLTQPPDLTPEALEQARYKAATWLEDAADIAARDPIASHMLLSQAVMEILRFAFMKANRFIPRDKDLLTEISLLDAPSAAKARKFFATSDSKERIRLATEIADQILGVRGFFEWSSQPETQKEPGNTIT